MLMRMLFFLLSPTETPDEYDASFMAEHAEIKAEAERDMGTVEGGADEEGGGMCVCVCMCVFV